MKSPESHTPQEGEISLPFDPFPKGQWSGGDKSLGTNFTVICMTQQGIEPKTYQSQADTLPLGDSCNDLNPAWATGVICTLL